MGAELRIIAHFSDTDVVIDQFTDLQKNTATKRKAIAWKLTPYRGWKAAPTSNNRHWGIRLWERLLAAIKIGPNPQLKWNLAKDQIYYVKAERQ